MRRSLMCLLILFLGTASVAAVQNVTDPCTNYKILDGKPRQRQVVTDTSNAICDEDLTPGWYRFIPGSGEVATSKVSKLHCGTVSPIWMDDTLPAPGPIVNKKFCFNHQDISPTGCLWSTQAPVKNCGTYIVYQLPLQSTLCPMAMCTDPSIKPCPPGQTSQSGFAPCRNAYPTLTNVTLSGPEEPLLPGDFKHVCHFASPDKSADAIFSVTWSMDGVPISNEIVRGLKRIAWLDLENWKGHINQKLTCSVKTYFESMKNHTSKTITSNSYFGGIKIEPTPLQLPEGTDKTIEIKTTLPLLCKDPIQQAFCQLHLHITSPNVFTVDSCHFSLRQHDASVPVEIASVVDPAVKPDVNTYLAVDVSYNESVTGLDLWANATQFKVEVLVTDSKLKSCVAGGDPHFSQSFAYPATYHLYHQGDFNFASDMRAPIAVQIETNTLFPPTHRPMISAIAVQTGNDVTIIDTYGGSQMASITSNRPLTSQIVQACGTNEYQVSTSTGHRLNIYREGNSQSTYYLNVEAHFPEGLISLGNITNNINYTYHEVCDVKPNTEGLMSFGSGMQISYQVIHLFRVLPNQNLLKGDMLPMKKTPPKQYCSCTQASPGDTIQAKCSMGMKADDPMVKRSSCKIIQPTISIGIRSPTRPGEKYENNNPQEPNTWPTHSGITENQARTKCRQDIVSFAPEQCVKIKALSMEEFVDSCVEDVLSSDGYSFNGGSVRAFTSKCAAAMLSNPANSNHSILPNQCPNLCNTQGACVKGLCQCRAGWEWEDCSVKSGEQFQITGIQGGIMCDKSVSNGCYKPVLNVENLGDVSNCTVYTTAYVKGRPSKAEGRISGIHERESSYSVSCNFESEITQTDFYTKRFRIHLVPKSVTQNSQYIDYVVFDGVCQKCLEDLTCFMKQDACLIEGKCHKDGELKILDQGFGCDPNQNMERWTIIPVGHFYTKRFRIHLVPKSVTQNSQYIDYVVFDGVCQKCLEDLTCFMKQDACLIEGKCHKDGELKILDQGFGCDPNQNMERWTIIPVGRK